MTPSQLMDALIPYRDTKYYFIGDGEYPSDPSGNSALYEGHVVALSDGEYINNLNYIYSLLKVVPGLINRKPNASDRQTHDDYTGLALKSIIADDIVEYGKANYGFYDNNNPNKSLGWYLKTVINNPEYLIRFNHYIRPGQRAHYRMMAGHKISLLSALIWSGSIITTSRNKQNESGKLLDYLKLWGALTYAEHQNTLVQRIILWTAKYFYSKVDIKETYRIYFGNKHPFYIYIKERL